MTMKRYFKRMWEDEFYIFDSETISENEFDEKVEYEDYQAFADSMLGDEVVELLNELHEENLKLNDENEKLKKGMIRVVDRYIKNVECNPLSYAQPYRKVKRTLNNIREDLRSLIGDVE